MVAEKVLERVGLSVHHHEKPTEVKAGDDLCRLYSDPKEGAEAAALACSYPRGAA